VPQVTAFEIFYDWTLGYLIFAVELRENIYVDLESKSSNFSMFWNLKAVFSSALESKG